MKVVRFKPDIPTRLNDIEQTFMHTRMHPDKSGDYPEGYEVK